jgi:hypothetical protein
MIDEKQICKVKEKDIDSACLLNMFHQIRKRTYPKDIIHSLYLQRLSSIKKYIYSHFFWYKNCSKKSWCIGYWIQNYKSQRGYFIDEPKSRNF